MASFNAVRSAGAGEADIAGTKARLGVAGAGGTSRTDWAGVQGTKFSIGRKGEGEALRMDVGGAGEDKLLGGRPGRDSIHDKRLFRCAGNSMLRLLVPFLLLLLFDDCKEGEIYRVSA